MPDTYTIHLPDGTIAQRTGVSRHFTHAVIGRKSEAHARREADEVDRRDDIQLYARLISQSFGVAGEGEDPEEVSRAAKARLEGIEDDAAFVADARRRRHELVDERRLAGEFGGWHVLAWATSEERAMPYVKARKLASFEARQVVEVMS